MVLVKDDSLAQGITQGATALSSVLGKAIEKRRQQNVINQIFGTPETPQIDPQTGQPIETEQQVSPIGEARRLSGQQQVALFTEFPELAKFQQSQQATKDKMLQRERLAEKKFGYQTQLETSKRAYESNKEYLANINKTREAIPKREATLVDISNIIGKKDLSTLRNFTAEYLGNKGYDADYLRSANANDLTAAVKNEFIADTQSLPGGTRLNQYIERLFRQSLQSPLKSPESNLRITEMQRFLLDIDKKKIEVTDRMIDQYEKAGREPPAHLSSKVGEQLKPYVQEKITELTKLYKGIDSGKIKARTRLNLEIAKDRIRDTQPKEGFVWIMNPRGQPVQIPKNVVKDALDNGGTLIR